MNSFVDTVPRKSRASGASGEKGQGEGIYSGAEGREGGAVELKEKKKGKRSAGGGAGKKSEAAEAAERAIAALKRTRAPFTANESIIGRADDTTLPLEDEDEVEITMEELPVAGQRFGHRGWVAGGGTIEEEEEMTGEQGGTLEPHLLPSGNGQGGAVESGHVGGKSKNAGRGQADKPVKKMSGARVKKRDDVRWSSDDDDPPGDGLGLNSEVERANTFKAKGGGSGERYVPQEGNGGPPREVSHEQSGVGATDGQEGATVTRIGEAKDNSGEAVRKDRVKIKTFLDERNERGGSAARADLKRERRVAGRSEITAARKRAGAERKLQQDFDDAVDELRNAKPLLLGVSETGENKIVIWGRKAALEAMEEVGLTSQTWGDYAAEDQDSSVGVA